MYYLVAFFIFFFVSPSFSNFDNFNFNSTYGCAEEDDIYDGQVPYNPPTVSCTDVLGSHIDNGCSPTETNYFTGGKTLYHPSPFPSTWILANTSAGDAFQTQSHEMFVEDGNSPSIEFAWHSEGGSPCGSNDHVVLASHVYFEEQTCNVDNLCMGCDGSINNCSVGIGESGCVQDHSFYAVIAGGFGSNGLPYNSCGFVFEKASQYWEDGVWKRRVILFPSSYINYNLEDNTWYKMKLEEFNNKLYYTVFKHNGSYYSIIGTKFIDINEGLILPQTHKVGIYGYWIREGVHVDFNNFVGDIQ